MSYASATLGSASLSGLSAAAGEIYTFNEALLIGVHRRTVEYNGEAEYFAIETRMQTESEDIDRVMHIYSHNDPSETPQFIRTVGVEAFYTQSIVGAARFIVVDLELFANLNPISITITGREYFQ